MWPREARRVISAGLCTHFSSDFAGGIVIDIGCGTGEHLDWFAAHGITAVGVEPSARMREITAAQGHRVVSGTSNRSAR